MPDRTDAARAVQPLDPYRIQVSYGARQRAAGIVQGSGADWFGPLDPLLPVAPREVRGRAFDFPAGYNADVRPRAYEPITFSDLRGLAESYDLLRLVIETRKDQIARLEWSIVPRGAAPVPGRKHGAPPSPALQRRAAEIAAFLRRPDGIHRWADWLRLLLEDLFVIDAPALFVHRNRGGKFLSGPPAGGGPYGLHPVDGATLKRVIDDWGRTPAHPAVAYQHVLHGVPAVEYTTRDILYRPRNARTHRAYGLSPVEQILMTVNIALRRQLFTLQYFTEGNIPESLIGVPETWTPDQIAAFQANWDAMLEGNLAARRHAKFVPGGVAKTFVQVKDPELKGMFDEWLARLTCYAFSVSPEPFLSKVNRATAESAHDQALEEGLAPLQDFVKGLIDDIIERDDLLAEPELEFRWQDDREVDPVKQETVLSGYVKSAIYTINETRDRLGLDPLPEAAASTAMVLTGQGYVGIGTTDKAQHASASVEKYDADQPRIPAGRVGGGQWTRGDGAEGVPPEGADNPSRRYASLERPAAARNDDAETAARDGSGPLENRRYAAMIVPEAGAVTGDPLVDNTTAELAQILVRIMDATPRQLGMIPAAYGTWIHVLFAKAVRAAGIPGIRPQDVETTFPIGLIYGGVGSIRTDAVLRNPLGDIVAIYDVKTGAKGLTPARVAELRRKTGAGDGVPVIELRFNSVVVKSVPVEIYCWR